MSKSQSLENKKGEVTFRQKLYQKLLEDNNPLVSPQIAQAVEGTRSHQTNARQAFKKLQKMGIILSPYLDLGAASCSRSMVLENEFRANGAAGDLSFEALKFSSVLARGLGYKKIPLRLVFDIYHLPFQNNSFPFVFTFQTLHHLPDPRPAFEEIKRVLAPGGSFYLGEEPVKQTLNLNLWRRGSRRNIFEKILMGVGVLPFLTRIGKDEVENGILEESFSLKQWQDFLSVFDQVRIEIVPFKLGPKSTKLNPPFLTRLVIFFLGGGLNGLCHVQKKGSPRKFKNLLEALACPECADHPLLVKHPTRLSCPECHHEHIIKDGIIFLLPKKLEKELYGQI